MSDLMAGVSLAHGPTRTVSLSRIAAALAECTLTVDVEVSGIAFNSREVRPGDLFMAYSGEHHDGHLYANEAVQRGAAALVVQRRLDVDVAQLIVPSVSEIAGPLASEYYHRPSSALDIVGVTGTNGKTTTCQLLRACLGSHDAPAAQIGTTGSFFGDDLLVHPSLSTPEAPDLQRLFADLLERGAKRVAMEVTSHGLHRHRVSGTRFRVGIFLNLSPEHLDYHGSMEEYFETKRRMFEESRCDAAIICVDDEWGRRLASSCEIPVTTFGRDASADVQVITRKRGLDGLLVRLVEPGGAVDISSPLIGEINGANIAAAFLASRVLEIDQAVAVEAIATCTPPPGRFEVITRDEPYLAVADYAHTPDSLEALIATAREVSTGQVVLVLGARGRRYTAKRPEMARIASLADRVFLTTDNPGDEDPQRIIDEMLAGVPRDRLDRVIVESDRAAAIRRSVESLESGDILLMTGRGPEGSQRFGNRQVVLDDRVVARLALDARAETDESTDESTVVVVISAHDSAEALATSIDSVIAQSAAVGEIVVVDDGSTDMTVEIARSLAPTVRLVRQPHYGVAAGRNAGVANSSSRWIAFLEPGDVWHPRKLEVQLAHLSESGALLCATEWRTPDAEHDAPGDAVLASPVTPRELSTIGYLRTSSVLVRRDAFGRAGGFNSGLDDDEAHNLWLRIGDQGDVQMVHRPLTLCRASSEGLRLGEEVVRDVG